MLKTWFNFCVRSLKYPTPSSVVQGKGTSYYQATQISKLSIGTVTSTKSVVYYASYRYRHKTFKKTAVVSVYG